MKLRFSALAIGATALVAAVALGYGHAIGTRAGSLKTPATAGELPGASLYQLASVWTTDAKQSLVLADLRGSFQVLALIFTRCPSACPTLVKELAALDRQFPEDIKANTKFVLISIDPASDTPEVLQAYRQKMGLDSRWTLLRGAEESVRELAATLGFAYSGGKNVSLAHSKLVTVLNPDGEIVHQQTGVQAAEAHKISDAIQSAMSARARL